MSKGYGTIREIGGALFDFQKRLRSYYELYNDTGKLPPPEFLDEGARYYSDLKVVKLDDGSKVDEKKMFRELKEAFDKAKKPKEIHFRTFGSKRG